MVRAETMGEKTAHKTLNAAGGLTMTTLCTRSGNATLETCAMAFRKTYASYPVSDKSNLDMSTMRKIRPCGKSRLSIVANAWVMTKLTCSTTARVGSANPLFRNSASSVGNLPGFSNCTAKPCLVTAWNACG